MQYYSVRRAVIPFTDRGSVNQCVISPASLYIIRVGVVVPCRTLNAADQVRIPSGTDMNIGKTWKSWNDLRLELMNSIKNPSQSTLIQVKKVGTSQQ